MTLKIHNTQSKQKEVFEPLNPEQITVYVCGPTVYNYIHIGNARPVVVFDTLFRLLQKTYPSVKYARNITDVDDKINKAAKEHGVDISAISNQFTEAFHEDIAQLNALSPSVEPRATGHIDEMQDMIQRLIDAGHAYESEGHVLFDVPSMPDYGKLSHRQQEDQLAGARVEVESYKRDASDFVLWKPSTDDLPGWDSPWGYGRPGWHLECSAMIEKHLGDTIDIHGGGQDLVFPHHENEIAQSQCAHGGKTFVRYWMHNGYITIDGEKMSKSLGNFFTLREILALYPGEAIRYALLSGHYRSPLNWSEDLVVQAKASLDRFYTALQNCPEQEQVDDYQLNDLPETFVTAMEDDLNTSEAFAAMHQITGELNKAITVKNKDTIASLQQQLLACGDLLGLLKQVPDAWFRWTPDNDETGLTDDAIEALLEERLEARKNKDFARADEIRDQLSGAGITIKDSAEGTQWQRG